MEMEGSFLWGRLTRQQPFSTLPYGSGCGPDLQNGERFASRVEDLSQVSPGRMCNADAKRFTQRRAGLDSSFAFAAHPFLVAVAGDKTPMRVSYPRRRLCVPTLANRRVLLVIQI